MAKKNVFDDTEDEPLPFRYAITSYGADYPVDSLVQRLEKDVVFVPEFQRKYVWRLPQASKFIESLLLGLPVPGVFLAKEEDTGKLLIIDGQQRLRTLQYFYKGIFEGKEFVLKDITSRFEGKTYLSLDHEDQLRLNDAVIHATIVRQDQPSEDQSSIYHIFERLNTGGTLLQPQEIRACIYYGEFANLLEELNNTPEWRKIYGSPSKRLKDQELILRFFALYFHLAKYSRPMIGFLNSFMGFNRKLKHHDSQSLKSAFIPTIQFIHKALGDRAFRPERSLNAAVYDSIMVGTAKRLSKKSIDDAKAYLKAYENLLANTEYLSAITTATADESNVILRINKAVDIFSGIR